MEHPANVRTVYFVGAGMGQPDGLTGQALQALRDSDLILGAKRLLSLQRFWDCLSPAFPRIRRRKSAGFYRNIRRPKPSRFSFPATSVSTAVRQLRPPIWPICQGYPSSFGAASVRSPISAPSCKRPGRTSFPSACMDGRAILAAVGRHRKTFVLTDRERTPGVLCRELCDAGLPDIPVSIGERLSYPEERICRGTARQWAGETFHPLSVMLVENPRAAQDLAVHGIRTASGSGGKRP